LQTIPEVEVPNLESLKSFKSKPEKELLLEEYDEELKKVKNITFKNLLLVYLLIVMVLGLLLPKIYVSNEIYYMSKNINEMYHTYTALKEENTHLKTELERLRYQVEVLDEIEEL